MNEQMKKKMALLLASAMLVSAYTVPAVYADSAAETGQKDGAASAAEQKEAEADGDITRSRAEQLLRQYISIPKEYKLQSSSFSRQELFKGEQKVCRMDFVKTVNGKHSGTIYASLDANTGQLLSFDSYADNPGAAPTYPLKVNREAAKELAQDFIEEVAKDYVSQIKLNESVGVNALPPLSGEVRHEIRFDRIVGDVPYLGNYIQLSIDSEGHVLGFQLNWDNTIEFPKADKTIPAAQAEEIIRKIGVPELSYIVPGSQNGKPEPALAYSFSPIVIDAVTGEELPLNGYDDWNGGTVEEKPLTEKPLSLPPKGGKLTEEEAVEAVKKAFGLPEGAELQGTNYNEYELDSGEISTRWDLSWRLMKDGKEAGYLQANVNGSTGAILSYYGWSNQESGQTGTSITLDAAVQKAVETVKQQLPWITDELYLVKPDAKNYEGKKPEEIGSYSITFRHKVHGADVSYDRISVSINARTGKVEYYDATIVEHDYPAKAPTTIKTSEALDRYMDYYDIALTYRVFQEYWMGGIPLPIEKYNLMRASGEINEDQVEERAKVELVYLLQQKPRHETVFLDAVSGQWRSHETGAVTTLEVPKATDAAGHWAEESLGLMVAYKALDLEDGKVRPNERITRGELIKMLVLARSGGGYYSRDDSGLLAGAAKESASFNDVAADSAYFVYVESALEQNLIDLGDGSFNPDATVTREEMAELIVRALGYNTLANYDHIFKASFKDEAEIDNKGQAAIVVGLKIMSLSDGKFLPDKSVTRAEASIAFYRYLQKRAELQEAPLRM